ncbi:MAG: DUF6268 family outer membrane beta-barrel protein [Planctomycetota bacterium]
MDLDARPFEQPGGSPLDAQRGAFSNTQPAGAPGGPGGPPAPFPDLRIQSITVLPADVQDTDGELTVQRMRVELGYNIPISQQSRLRLSFDHESSFYNFTNVDTLSPQDNDPLDYAASNFVGALFSTQFNEETGLIVGGNLGISGEAGTSFSDALLGRAFIAPTFQIDEKTNIGIGVIALTRLEADPIVVPFLQLQRQVTDRLSIGSQGRGLGATYDLNEYVNLRGSLGLDFRQYRLDEDSGQLRDGIFQEVAVNVGLGADIQAAENVSINLDVNLLPYREIEFQEADTTRVSKFTTDPTVSLSLGVRVRF